MAFPTYESWHTALVSECRRRIGLDWQTEFDRWNDRNWYDSGNTPSELIDHLIAKYDLEDLDEWPIGSVFPRKHGVQG